MGCGKAGVRSNRKKFEPVLVARGSGRMYNRGQNLEGFGKGLATCVDTEKEGVHIRWGEAGSPAPCWMQAAQQVFTLGCR
jgi:hypothetical protein